MAGRSEYGNEMKGSMWRVGDIRDLNNSDPNGMPSVFGGAPADAIVTIISVDDSTVHYQWEANGSMGSGGMDRDGVLLDSEGRVAGVTTLLFPDDELRIRPTTGGVNKQAEIQRVAQAARRKKMTPYFLWGGAALLVGGVVYAVVRNR